MRLFKFMTAATALAVLRNRTLRWSTPRTFNDPFDVQFDLRIEIDPAEVRQLSLEKAWQDRFGPNPAPAGNALGLIMRSLRGIGPDLTLAEFEREFGDALDQSIATSLATLPRFGAEARRHLRNSKILCLTIAPENFLMWTHYAGQHTGVVLEFRNVPGLDSPWSEARAVNYVDELPVLIDNEELSNVLSGRSELNAGSVIARLVYSKSRAFDYEREWRIYSGDGRDPELAFEDLGFHPDELASVIFGARTAPQDEAQIRSIVGRHYANAAFHRAELQGDHFATRIIPA